MNLQQPIHLFWGVQTEADAYLPELLNSWNINYPNFQYTIVPFEQGTQFLHSIITEQYPNLTNMQVIASGPVPMVKLTYQHLINHQLPLNQFFSDYAL